MYFIMFWNENNSSIVLINVSFVINHIISGDGLQFIMSLKFNLSSIDELWLIDAYILLKDKLLIIELIRSDVFIDHMDGKEYVNI